MHYAARRFAPVATACFLAGAAVFALSVVQPASAEVPRHAVCTTKLPPLATEKGAETIQAWMETQLSSGKSDFLLVGSILCAW